MPVIFISYRREDTSGHSGRLFDRLKESFGSDHVFLDVVGIEAGVDFVESIDKAISSCDVLLAVIGRAWLSCCDKQGRCRLDDKDDFIRAEISSALQRNVRVIPLLVNGAEMPPPDALPEELKPLTRRQAVELRDSRWATDVESLLAILEHLDAAARPGNAHRATTSVVPPLSARPARVVSWVIGAVVAALLAVGAVRFLSDRNKAGVLPTTEPTPTITAASPPSPELHGTPEPTPSQTPGRQKDTHKTKASNTTDTDDSLPRLYLLSVGINDYGRPAANRHSAVASAQAIAGFFAKQKHRAFSDVQSVVLTESQATQEKVLRALRAWARTATSNDLAILYFAGRSAAFPTNNSPGRYAFLCFDSDYSEPERTGISGKMLLDFGAEIASPKLVILDTPTHGGIFPQKSRDYTPSVEIQRLPALTTLVGSVGGEETESSFGQSSFSKALLDGLNMAADKNHDNVITFGELTTYVFDHGSDDSGVATPPEFRELNGKTVLARGAP
jgi:hypothetical protein